MSMPAFTTRIECVGHVDAPVDIVWSVVGAFGSAWHPAMSACRLETVRGAVERVFTVEEGERAFRERQIFRSDGERRVVYRMTAGSDVLDRYDATLLVEEDDGSKVVWSATVSGHDVDAVRTSAEETRSIFKAGLDFLGQRLALKQEMIEVPHRLGLLSAGEGELVLFLHGIGGRKENWLYQLQALAMNARAVALDLRGYGDSSPAPDRLSLDDHFADILAVMAHFGAGRVHLVGLSYGSWIAASFAHSRPDLVASLTLSGGCTGMSEALPESVAAFRAARTAPLDRGLSPADIAPEIVSTLKGPECSSAAEAELMSSMRAIPAATYRAAISCFTRPSFRLDFTRWTMPVLMMTGEFDRLASPTEIGSVAQRIFDVRTGNVAQAEVVVAMIPRAGHLCNLEAPKSYVGHLSSFLSRHLRAPEGGADA